MNISSSVVTPPRRVHASQNPSAAFGPESHAALRFAGVLPTHVWPTFPCVQPDGIEHGPPNGKPFGVGGEVDFIFAALGSVVPLS